VPQQGAAEPRATSVDGRQFFYALAVNRLDLRVGGYVVIEADRFGRRLGFVTSIELAPDDPRSAHVTGRMLEGPREPFGEAAVRLAKAQEVARWLESAPAARAQLDVGRLTFAEDVPLRLDSGAFDRHTFLCGQSGSGKTYALGTILERLLVETSLRILVLDPNSDFVRLAALRDEVDDTVRSRYAAWSSDIDVRQAADHGRDRLHVRFRDLDAAEQAAVLRLDPIDDRDEYAALADELERYGSGAAGAPGSVGTARETIDRFRESAEPLRSLGVRARNLQVDRWRIWSGDDPESLGDLAQPGGARCVVADLGSVDTREEQAVAAEALLAALWRRRVAREPTLIVIDEAHNICPARPADPLTALATEHAVRIAGEGRKFGLVLLVATQRPQKVHENVVSQCDNLVLMRMNSRSDLALLSEAFSFVPAPMLAVASDFGQGEAVLAGKLVPAPTLGRFGPRWSAEGGADVPTDWAVPRG
jgi:DNA helicase HerA-like ATPase